MGVDDRDVRALEIVQLYYQRGFTQAEIASQMGLSRPTIAKLIQYAHDKGFVTISINDPRSISASLESELCRMFGLQRVQVAMSPTLEGSDSLELLGIAGAQMLQSMVKNKMTIGVAWGNTLWSLARHLQHSDVQGVEIVQLKGGLSFTSWESHDTETMSLFCRAFNATGRYLHLPVIFNSAQVKSLVEQERHLAKVLEMGRKSDVAVFTVGCANSDSLLLKSGYFTDLEVEHLTNNATGDICSRFFNRQGEICLPELDSRTVGIGITELKNVPTRVLIAGGVHKVSAIETALKSGFATHLVTDEFCARALLERTKQTL